MSELKTSFITLMGLTVLKCVHNYLHAGATSFEIYHKVIQQLFREIVDKGMPASDDFSVAAQLMRLKNKGSISDERILAEIGILFVGGFETTAHTISWTLFCIVTNRGEYSDLVYHIPTSYSQSRINLLFSLHSCKLVLHNAG